MKTLARIATGIPPRIMIVVGVACGASQKQAPPDLPATPPITAAAPRAVPHATLAFTHVHVFDGERALDDASVLVDGDRIVAVGSGLTVPAGAELIDGRGQTLLPGLIDAHVHVYGGGALLEQALAFGVTTVLDMFTDPEQVKKLRADSRPDHADLRSAGILATAPGGHGSEYGMAIPTLSRPEQAEAFVDARIAEGSDYIKIVFDDGRAYKRSIPTLDTPTFAAVVNAAHRRGKLAVVHIGDYDHARLAIDHGADGLVHLFGDRAPEPDFGARVAAHHAFVTPTLTVVQAIYGARSQIASDPAIAPYLRPEAQANLEASFGSPSVGEPDAVARAIAQLRDAGAAILCGTDAPNPGTTFGASMHEELGLLVGAGLSPTAALTAATAAPAARFGLADRGRIAVGLRADLVLVKGDPLADITATRQIAGVWRGGHRFDRDGYRQRVAAAIAEAAARVPTGELGLISDFETGATARGGQDWIVSTSTSSTATLATVAGAHGSKGALGISGQLVTGATALWAGAMWSPGAAAFRSTDLSAKHGFSFLARGDGKPYTAMVFTKRHGFAPAVQTFRPGAAFAPVRFTWRQFNGLDGSDVTAIFIGQATVPGAFQLAIDDFALQ